MNDSTGPFTFKVEIDTNFVGSLGQVYRTFGEATVTIDDFDESGWFGSVDGHGEYSDWGKRLRLYPSFIKL